MIPNPILKALSSIRKNNVRCLLMGGQACILYGAAEFSRDADLAIIADEENLSNLRVALAELDASVIAIPPFEPEFLAKGHVVHFRCSHLDANGVRVDIMSKMRGVDSFPELWSRRTTITVDGESLDVMSLPDLVKAKKTQRDKDWPMIRRLVDTNYFENKDSPTNILLNFWFSELRAIETLTALVHKYPEMAVAIDRAVVRLALAGADEFELANALHDEEQTERIADKLYWEPLRRELTLLRHAKPK